jgi:hypothetical protein
VHRDRPHAGVSQVSPRHARGPAVLARHATIAPQP